MCKILNARCAILIKFYKCIKFKSHKIDESVCESDGLITWNQKLTSVWLKLKYGNSKKVIFHLLLLVQEILINVFQRLLIEVYTS